jgi:hypothetical protein
VTHAPTHLSFKPAHLTAAAATAIVGFTVHAAALIAHEVMGDLAWPRWLELVYLVSLFVWVPAGAAVLWIKARLKHASVDVILDDERSQALFTQAHVVAVLVVLIMQLPFVVGVDVPAKALALLTVTTCVVTLFATYAWLDR